MSFKVGDLVVPQAVQRLLLERYGDKPPRITRINSDLNLIILGYYQFRFDLSEPAYVDSGKDAAEAYDEILQSQEIYHGLLRR